MSEYKKSARLCELVDTIMQNHNLYTNVSIKPKYCQESLKYVEGVSVQTYIAGLPDHSVSHITHDSFDEAISRLQEVANGEPCEIIEQLRKEKIDSLKRSIENFSEQLAELERDA